MKNKFVYFHWIKFEHKESFFSRMPPVESTKSWKFNGEQSDSGRLINVFRKIWIFRLGLLP